MKNSDFVLTSIPITKVATEITSFGLNGYKQGNLVSVDGYIVIAAGTYPMNKTLFTLPVKTRKNVFVPVSGVQDDIPPNLKMTTDGKLNLDVDATFPAQRYLFVNFSFWV